MKQQTVKLETAENGDVILQLTTEMIEHLGVKIGDTVTFKLNEDKESFTILKAETEFVSVETIQSFKIRYVVEVPKGKTEYALETVTLQKAKEFSQQALPEVIFSHRVISKEEALRAIDEDNPVYKAWSTEHKIRAFLTTWPPESNDLSLM